MIYPGEAHLDLLLEVGPARPVGQRPVQERLDPGEAVAEDRVQGHAHPVDKLNLPQIFLSEPSSGHENSTKYLKWIQIYLFEVAGQQYAVVTHAHLHLRQLVLALPVHHPHWVDAELHPLHVALVEELVRHLLGGLVLQLPRLGDGRHVRSCHQHPAQQLLPALRLKVGNKYMSRY